MDEVENLKQEFDHLGATDKRWIAVCGIVAVCGVLFAFFIGNAIGDVVGFVLALAAGWVLRSQWQLVTGRRANASGTTGVARRAAKARSHAATPRRATKSRAKTSAKHA